MPPATKRNGSVILFDVKTNPQFAEAARKCLLNICASKWFCESKDTTKLLLLNTEETNNAIHSKFDKCPHVLEATDVIGYDPKLMKSHIEGIATAEADWLMGLAVALEEIKENFVDAKGIMNRQLLFITDFSTPVTPKDKRIEFVKKNLNKMDVHLYILGPEVRFPNYLSSFEDVQQWSKNIEFVGSEEVDNPNLAIAKSIVQDTKGIMCDLQLGQELFKNYSEHWGMQPWKVPLTIGSSLTIPSSTTRFLKSKSAPRIKGATLAGSKEPWSWHLVDDLLAEIPHSNVIGGIFRHGKFVALPPDVEKDFKYIGPRCFKIIGFTEQRNIPEFYMRGDGSNYVESDDSKTFKLLLHVLAKKNMCAIAQKVYMQNCKPKLVALLPQPQEGILVLVDLPYGDNVKGSFAEQGLSEAVKLEDDPAVNAMYDYLQQCDISDPNNRDENGSVRVPLAASLMDSFRLNVVAKQCLRKYLGEEMDVEESIIKLPEFVDAAPYKEFVPVREVVEPKKQASN